MADPDQLEYYIRFPSPGYDYGAGSTLDDYVFVVDEKRIPIVLLFGWAGCQDRYLAKYSAIYEDKGLITIRYTAPVSCLFWRQMQMKTIGERLVRLLLDMNFDTHPIIVHLFSNGGAFLYQNFSNALSEHDSRLQVKGVIFDSAPGKRRVVSLYRAISAIVGGGCCYNVPVSFVLTLFLSFVWLYEVVRDAVWPALARMQSNPIVALRKETNKWPQHFIYSKTDTLIPYTDIEDFAGHRETLGVPVTTLRFDRSPHVKHYSHNRSVYVNSVCSFINRCLGAPAH